MGKMPHIRLDESIGADCAIMPGDPARVLEIAKKMSDVREETFNREYRSITGTYKGRRILAISTGMGGVSTAICVEELADLGVKQMIRIGSCGALNKELSLGQLVICPNAVCDDGTSQTYLGRMRYAAAELNEGYIPPEGLSMVDADSDLSEKCILACRQNDFPWAVGPARTHDGLYLKNKPALDEFYSKKGIYASDNETAALFAVGKVRGVRCASILNVVVEWKKDLREGVGAYKDGAADAAAGEENEIVAALEALTM